MNTTYKITATRRSIYADWRKRRVEQAETGPDANCLPLRLEAHEMQEFAALAPRGTRWSYSMPGVNEGDAASYQAAVEALDGLVGRVGAIRAFIHATVPGVERVSAKVHGL